MARPFKVVSTSPRTVGSPRMGLLRRLPRQRNQRCAAEVDLYGGYNYALSDTTEIGIKAIYYWYPTRLLRHEPLRLRPNSAATSATPSKSSRCWASSIGAGLLFESGDSVYLAGNRDVPLFKELWLFDGGVKASARVAYNDRRQRHLRHTDYLTWESA